MTRRAIEVAILITLFLPAGDLSPASVDQEWLTPAYPAQSSEQHTVTLKYKYTYEERQFIPSHSIEPSPRNTWAFTSPESAMIARASAMKQLDFEGWLATWDQPSQLEMQEKAKKRNHELSEIVDQWKGILEVGRMSMVRRIKTGEYVIITYRVVDETGLDIGQVELPSVYHLVDGRWLGTQGLSSDVLLLESPWATGQQHVERTLE